MDGGKGVFQTINRWSDLGQLILGGEAEGLHLECKSPRAPQLTRDQKTSLAVALSGFSNTAGGVILYGVSTTRHAHSGLDILSQLEPIGQIRRFELLVGESVPTLTTPVITDALTRIIKETPADSKGVLAVYVPMSQGDPVQSAFDDRFYFRTGDEFKAAPYDLIRRMFSATETPDLRIIFDPRLAAINDEGAWVVPIALKNNSSAIAEHVKMCVEIENPDACEQITSPEFTNVSLINPDKTLFLITMTGVIHRGLNIITGNLHVTMKVGKRRRRRLDIKIQVFANKMRARQLRCQLNLVQSGFSATKMQYSDVY